MTPDGTAYVEIQDNGKQSPLHMHLIVCRPFISHCLHPCEACITFSEMSYQVTEGSGYVLITLLVMGQVSVECTVVVDITNGVAPGECSGIWHSSDSGWLHSFTEQVFTFFLTCTVKWLCGTDVQCDHSSWTDFSQLHCDHHWRCHTVGRGAVQLCWRFSDSSVYWVKLLCVWGSRWSGQWDSQWDLSSQLHSGGGYNGWECNCS